MRLASYISLLVTAFSLFALELARAETSLNQMQGQVELLKKDLESSIEEFNKRYEGELQKLKEAAKAEGNVDLAIAVSTELVSFRTGESKPASEPRLKRLQEIYAEHSARLRAERNRKAVDLLKNYQLRLVETIEGHVRSGDTDAVPALRREVESVVAEIKELESEVAGANVGSVVDPSSTQPGVDPPMPKNIPDSPEIVSLKGTLERAVDEHDEDHPSVQLAEFRLLNAYLGEGRVRDAIPYMANAFSRSPGKLNDSIKVAALQVWFGMDEGIEATRERMVEWVEDIDFWIDAQHEAMVSTALARMINMQTANKVSQRRMAQEYAEGAVARLGELRGMRSFALFKIWTEMELGIAEYRMGNFEKAEEILTKVTDATSENSSARQRAMAFCAMSKFKRGKKEEAIELVREIERGIRLPSDVNNPPIDSNDSLSSWLAFREAARLIKP